MPKDPLEAKLAALRELRSAEPAARAATLRRFLHERSNYLVAKAAELAAECGHVELVADLLEVYDGYFGDHAAQRDPLVRGKDAIARALHALGHRDPAPFMRGLHHVQLEPVFARTLEDAASRLRCACAHALIDTELPTIAALRELLPHLVDPLTVVRIDTVRAVAQLGGSEALVALRLKAYAGDPDPEVIGECFAGVLDREPDDAVAFIAPFLDAAADAVKVEAVTALALSRDAGAIDCLRTFWRRGDLDDDVRAATVTAWGGSPHAAVTALLLEVVAGSSERLAERAIRALAQSRFRDEVHDRTLVAVEAAGSSRLRAAFAEAFSAV